MRKELTFIVLSFFAVMGSMFAQTTYAEETKVGTGFTYQVLYPDNQQTETGYYNLKMGLGQKQTVTIVLMNPTDKEITVDVGLKGAKTNPNGVIEYASSEFKSHKTLKFDFADIVKGPSSVKLAPSAQENLNLEITMPETSYDGIILGGIQLKRQTSEEEKAKESGTTVRNEYAYVIGMILQVTDVEVKPVLNYIETRAGQQNYQNAIVVDLANEQSAIMENLTVEAQVMTEKSDEVLYEYKKLKMRMAPDSVLNFPISMDGQPMIAGKYRIHIVATTDEDRWEWTEPFEITKEQAEKFNRDAVGLIQNRGMDFSLVAKVVGGVLGLVIIVFILVRVLTGKNKKKQPAKKKRKKKK